MKPGEISNAINTGRGGAVIALVDKQIPSDEEFAKNKDQFREELLGQKRNELLEVYVTTLRDKMEKNGQIKIFQKNLDRLAKNNNAAE
jgi:peptidyl-prolyl cis-trans isomerase D